MSRFSKLHPVVNFVYLALVITLSMVLTNPVCLAISLLSSLLYALRLSQNGRKLIFFFVPFILLFSLTNPLFNHQGVNIITYFHDGNPLTLESIVYGFASAFMLISVMLWFVSFNKIMTSDKLMYLFGRILPAFSLIFSMILRFVPRFLDRLRKISDARRSLRQKSPKGIVPKAKEGLAVLSSLTTYALENSVDISDSMKSRGYGLRNRTSFSVYTFSKSDVFSLLAVLVSGISVIVLSIFGQLEFYYFPAISRIDVTPTSILSYALYLLLCIYPQLFDLWEELKWNVTELKI